MVALVSYWTAVSELSPLILVIVAMLIVIGLAMWVVEKRDRSAAQGSDSAVVSLRDGLYWAVVTMTTVGYGDKTPKTMPGRVVAMVWMLSSLVLVSLLSTSLVSRLTAERVESRDLAASIDLRERKSRRWPNPRAPSISTSCICNTQNIRTSRKRLIRW